MAKKKEDFMEIAQRMLPTFAGGAVATYALNAVENYVIPRFPQLAGYPWAAPAAVAIAGAGLEYWMQGRKDMEMARGIGAGMFAVAGAELASMYLPIQGYPIAGARTGFSNRVNQQTTMRAA